MIYEIANPCDAVTIEADDSVLASVAVIVLGHGAYGLYDEDDRVVLPIFLLEKPEKLVEWLTDHGIDSNKMDEFYARNGEEVAKILESMVYGKVEDRKALTAMTEKMSASDRLDAIEKWNESRRTSMNNIGADARNIAKAFRKKAEEARIAKAPTDPPPVA